MLFHLVRHRAAPRLHVMCGIVVILTDLTALAPARLPGLMLSCLAVHALLGQLAELLVSALLLLENRMQDACIVMQPKLARPRCERTVHRYFIVFDTLR